MFDGDNGGRVILVRVVAVAAEVAGTGPRCPTGMEHSLENCNNRQVVQAVGCRATMQAEGWLQPGDSWHRMRSCGRQTMLPAVDAVRKGDRFAWLHTGRQCRTHGTREGCMLVVAGSRYGIGGLLAAGRARYYGRMR